MARGFESKQVEFQQEEAQRRKNLKPAVSPEDQLAQERRRAREHARARAAADLERATNPNHRRMLEAAIAALDDQLGR
jgi:hypothetical protein